MNDENGGTQGLLGGLRVPIDPRAIILGMVMVVLFGGGVYGLNEAFYKLHFVNDKPVDFEAGVCGFFASLHEAPCSFQAVAGAWFLALWALLGGAINRIVAVRLAKDDSIRITEALGFSRRRFLSYFLTPVVLLALVAFGLGCNWLAGFVGKAPFVGPVFFILLYILVLVSSLFVTILLIGFVFGHNMIASAISTEGCDGIEASISVYNYIFARPWPFIAFTALIAVSVSFLMFIGDFLVNLSFKTTGLQKKVVSYDYQYKKGEGDTYDLNQVTVHERIGGGMLDGLVDRGSAIGSLLHGKSPTTELRSTTYYANAEEFKQLHEQWLKDIVAWGDCVRAAGDKARAINDRTDKSKAYGDPKRTAEEVAKLKTEIEELDKKIREADEAIAKGPSKEPIEPAQVAAYNWMVWDLIAGTRVNTNKGGKMVTAEFTTDHIQGSGSTMVRILAWAMLAAYWLLRLLVVGYVVAHVFAAYTTIYFVLRREVDGTEYEELYEEDEESFDFSEEASPPAPASPAPPAGPPAASAPQIPSAPPAPDKPPTPPPPAKP